MAKKIKKSDNSIDFFESIDRYLLDEYEEDFDYMNIVEENNKKRRSYYNESEY